MKLQLPDILILISYLLTMVLVGVWMRKKARQNKESYLMGGKSLALVYAWLKRCLGYVRYQRHDVDGGALFCLRAEKHLDSLAMAGI